MKLAHIADPHLGIRQYHRQTPAGINQREADVAHAFRAAIDGVIAARPDAVVIAGDLFHSVRPTNAAIVFAFRQFQRLREALPEAPIVLIAGNHDTPRSVETGSILRLFEELGVDVATDRGPPAGLSRARSQRPRRAPPGAARAGAAGAPAGGAASGTRCSWSTGGGGRVPDPTGARRDYGGAVVARRELNLEDWTYVALGHYHTAASGRQDAWYAGSLDYVSPNIWGELADEAEHGVTGRAGCWRTSTAAGASGAECLPRGTVLDLEPVRAEGKSAGAIDAVIAFRLATVPGGIADQIVRLVVFDIPRHVARELEPCRHPGLQGRRAAFSPRSAAARAPAHRRRRSAGPAADAARAGLLVSGWTAVARRARPRGIRAPGPGADGCGRARSGGRLMQINRLRLVNFRQHENTELELGPGLTGHRRAQRRRQDHAARGHRLGDVRHAGRARQPGDAPAPRRAAPAAGGGRARVHPGRPPVPHRALAEPAPSSTRTAIRRRSPTASAPSPSGSPACWA